MQADIPPAGFFFRRRFGLLAATASLIAISIYVFGGTPYQNYLYSDMLGFWKRAMERLNGDIHRESQFIVWPPLYHVFIADLFGKLHAIGLPGLARLETLLAINIGLYATSVYGFQRLAAQLFKGPAFLVTAVALYAVGMPALYLNAFLLSDNFSLPLFVIAIALAVCGRREWPSLCAAALLFGLAAIVRPAVAPYGLIFVVMYWVRFGRSWAFLKRSAVFSGVFFGIVLFGAAEVRHISEGKVSGLCANGGIDFFLATSRCHRADLNYDGWHWYIVAPIQSMKPENGFHQFDVPFYNQAYYYQQGWKYIQHNPGQLWKNMLFVTDLFQGRMLPSKSDAPWFDTLMPAWQQLKIVLFLLLGLYVWAWKDLGNNAPLCALLLMPWPILFLLAFFFTGEPRYSTQLLFSLYLLGFKLIEIISLNARAWRKRLLAYAALLVTGTGLAFGLARVFDPPPPPSIVVTKLNLSGPTNKIDQELSVGQLLFPYNFETGLRHIDTGPTAGDTPATIVSRTRMQVTGTAPLLLRLETCSSWFWELRINGHLQQDSFDNEYVHEIVTTIEFRPGIYDMEVSFHYSPGPGGFALSYSYQDSNDWRVRTTFGRNTPRVQFSKPTSAPCEAVKPTQNDKAAVSLLSH